MATRKKAGTSVAKASSTELANIKAELAEAKKALSNQIGALQTNQIRVSNSKLFKTPDGEQNPGPIRAVIIDFMTRHTFYPGAYVEGSPEPPTCFAIGRNPEEMVPSKSIETPQNKTCQGCPMNEFNTAQGGRGAAKACKNTRILALVPWNATSPETPIWTVQVAPTALKSFDSYIASLKRDDLHPIEVITEISFDVDAQYAKLCFKRVEENANLGAHWARRAEAAEVLSVEPRLGSSTEGAKKPRRKAA